MRQTHKPGHFVRIDQIVGLDQHNDQVTPAE